MAEGQQANRPAPIQEEIRRLEVRVSQAREALSAAQERERKARENFNNVLNNKDATKGEIESARKTLDSAAAAARQAQTDLDNLSAKLTDARRLQESEATAKGSSAPATEKAQREMEQRRRNESGSCGAYLTDLECEAKAKLGRDDERRDRNDERSAGQKDRQLDLQERQLELERKLEEGKLTLEQYKVELNKLYNEEKAAIDRLVEENKAATTILQNETQQRGQDLQELANRRNTVHNNMSMCAQFISANMQYMAKGTRITEAHVLAWMQKCDELAQEREDARGKSQAVPRVENPKTLTDTAEGKKTSGPIGDPKAAPSTQQQASGGPDCADPAISADPNALAECVKRRYQEWTGAGGNPDDWDAFVKHNQALGGPTEGVTERPASLTPQQPAAQPPQQPAAQPPAAPPVQQPTAPAETPAAASYYGRAGLWKELEERTGLAGGQSSPVGGITINVGQPQAQPATPQQPAVNPTKPDMDPDFNTATLAKTYQDLKSAGFTDDEIDPQFQTDQSQWGPFTQQIMGGMA